MVTTQWRRRWQWRWQRQLKAVVPREGAIREAKTVVIALSVVLTVAMAVVPAAVMAEVR